MDNVRDDRVLRVFEGFDFLGLKVACRDRVPEDVKANAVAALGVSCQNECET